MVKDCFAPKIRNKAGMSNLNIILIVPFKNNYDIIIFNIIQFNIFNILLEVRASVIRQGNEIKDK